jgi:hypothetical protein
LHRWPLAGDDWLHQALASPTTAVTTCVSLTGLADGELSGQVTIRLAGPPRAVDSAAGTLRRQLGKTGGSLRRYSGQPLAGIVDTLPLGAPACDGHVVTPLAVDAIGAPLRPSGVLLGRNRRGAAVTVRLLRPAPTRTVLYGGPSAAGWLTLRALAAGASVGVQTTRPDAWSRLANACTGLPCQLVRLGQPLAADHPSAAGPQLIITDAGGQLVNLAADNTPWRTHLLVRDLVTVADFDALAAANIVLLQPLPPESAALLARALGLPEAADWLPRIRPDMLAVITRTGDARRRTLRWARLTSTNTERQLSVTVS